MKFLASAFLALWCLAPGTASAATIASFSAEAQATLTLLSARIAGTTTDARDYLTFSDMDDAAWFSDTTGTGSLSEDADLSNYWDVDTDLWVEAAGRAEDPAGQARADAIFDRAIEFRNGDCWTDNCDVSIELTFGYALSAKAAASATGPGERAARAASSAFLGVGSSWGNLDLFRLTADAAAEPLFGFDANDAQSRSGTFSVTLGPDASLFAYLYVEYDGYARAAEVPAPVPLPASALLLVAGLGGLGAFGRRRASQG